MGQPSRNAVFISVLDPGIDSKLAAVAQSAYEGKARVGVAKTMIRMPRAAITFVLGLILVNISITPSVK